MACISIHHRPNRILHHYRFHTSPIFAVAGTSNVFDFRDFSHQKGKTICWRYGFKMADDFAYNSYSGWNRSILVIPARKRSWINDFWGKEFWYPLWHYSTIHFLFRIHQKKIGQQNNAGLEFHLFGSYCISLDIYFCIYYFTLFFYPL